MTNPMRDPFRRVRIGLVALTLVLLVGTTGYLLLGFDFLDFRLPDRHDRHHGRVFFPACVGGGRQDVHHRPDPVTSGHVIVCGWGRVGREVARFLVSAGRKSW